MPVCVRPFARSLSAADPNELLSINREFDVELDFWMALAVSIDSHPELSARQRLLGLRRILNSPSAYGVDDRLAAVIAPAVSQTTAGGVVAALPSAGAAAHAGVSKVGTGSCPRAASAPALQPPWRRPTPDYSDDSEGSEWDAGFDFAWSQTGSLSFWD